MRSWRSASDAKARDAKAREARNDAMPILKKNNVHAFLGHSRAVPQATKPLDEDLHEHDLSIGTDADAELVHEVDKVRAFLGHRIEFTKSRRRQRRRIVLAAIGCTFFAAVVYFSWQLYAEPVNPPSSPRAESALTAARAVARAVAPMHQQRPESDDAICRRGDHVRRFNRRRRLALSSAAAADGFNRRLALSSATAADGCHQHVLNATPLCNLYASHVRNAGIDSLIALSVDGFSFSDGSSFTETESYHVVGAWLAEQTLSALGRDPPFDEVTPLFISGVNAQRHGSLQRSDAPLHSFVWHSLARLPADRLVERAAELCRFQYSFFDYAELDALSDCLHGVGHGFLLNVLFRSERFAAAAACYSECSPLRQYQHQSISRDDVRAALSTCAQLAASEGSAMFFAMSKDCYGGVIHQALHLLEPAPLDSLVWLCELSPPHAAPDVWPGLPRLDTCMQLIVAASSHGGSFREDCRTGVLRPAVGMRSLGCVYYLTLEQFVIYDYAAHLVHLHGYHGVDSLLARSARGIGADLGVTFEERARNGRVEEVSGCYGNRLSGENGRLYPNMLRAWFGQNASVPPPLVDPNNESRLRTGATLLAWCTRFLAPRMHIGLPNGSPTIGDDLTNWRHAQLFSCVDAAADAVHNYASAERLRAFCDEDVPLFCATARLPSHHCQSVIACAPNEDAYEMRMAAAILALPSCLRASSATTALSETLWALETATAAWAAWEAISAHPTLAMLCVTLCTGLACVCRRSMCRRSTCSVHRRGYRATGAVGPIKEVAVRTPSAPPYAAS